MKELKRLERQGVYLKAPTFEPCYCYFIFQSCEISRFKRVHCQFYSFTVVRESAENRLQFEHWLELELFNLCDFYKFCATFVVAAFDTAGPCSILGKQKVWFHSCQARKHCSKIKRTNLRHLKYSCYSLITSEVLVIYQALFFSIFSFIRYWIVPVGWIYGGTRQKSSKKLKPYRSIVHLKTLAHYMLHRWYRSQAEN